MNACPRCGTPDAGGRLAICPVCAVADTAPLLLGQGALELGEMIGQGGMGAVYKARHLRLGRTVAVKFLAPGLADQAEFEARFEREARLLAILSHPNIVTVFDFGREDGESYLVMEYVDGVPLSRRIPMELGAAIVVADQVCQALAYAHARGVVHRDIKPENILTDAEGRVRVSDFGIARLVSPDTPGWTVTATRLAVGTPPYMSPEALRGAPPDPRMDLYALGVVLHQLVTGSLPHDERSPPPPPILAPVLSRALAADPALRYPDANAFALDLARVKRLAAVSPVVPAAALPPDERTFMRAVAVALSIATALSLWAVLLSLTPQVLAPGAVTPLVSVGNERLADGRVVSRARFEALPAIGALGAWVVALAGYAFLRRHWRATGLEHPTPEVPLRGPPWVFGLGAAGVGMNALRHALEARDQAWRTVYFPLVGGVFEVAIVYLVWLAVLEAWRTSRSLAREPLLALGAALALYPPTTELVRFLRDWSP